MNFSVWAAMFEKKSISETVVKKKMKHNVASALKSCIISLLQKAFELLLNCLDQR